MLLAMPMQDMPTPDMPMPDMQRAASALEVAKTAVEVAIAHLAGFEDLDQHQEQLPMVGLGGLSPIDVNPERNGHWCHTWSSDRPPSAGVSGDIPDGEINLTSTVPGP